MRTPERNRTMEALNPLMDERDLENHIVTLAFAWAAIHPYATIETRERLCDRVTVAVTVMAERSRG